MIASISSTEALKLRMQAQRLSGPRPQSVPELLRAITVIQAQDTAAARLSVRARSEGLDLQAVNRACNEERTVVRTWLLRGTLHMVPAEDVGWMVTLLGPRVAAGYRSRRLALGLDDQTCERALTAIRAILVQEEDLTRAELVERLAGQGLQIDPKGQAPAHLVTYAATTGLICRGPDRPDDEPTYALLERWVGERACNGDLAALARRYIGAYGPAGVADFAHWAGISLGEARRGLQSIVDELQEVELRGERAWVLSTVSLGPTSSMEPSLRLLPAYDTYLLGYRTRDLALDPRFATQIHPGGGVIHPAILLDGRVVGSWRAQRKGKALTILAKPFEELERTLLPLLEREANDVGRFLGTDVTILVEGGG